MLKFWEIPDLLTPFELQIHRVMLERSPPAPERDDMRMAWMFANLIANQVDPGEFSDEKAEKLLKCLSSYMEFLEPSASEKAKVVIQKMRERSCPPT